MTKDKIHHIEKFYYGKVTQKNQSSQRSKMLKPMIIKRGARVILKGAW